MTPRQLPDGTRRPPGSSGLSDGELLARAARLVEPGNVAQILSRIADLLVPTLGQFVVGYLVEDDRLRRVVVLDPEGFLRPEEAAGDMGLDEGSPLHTALRTRRAETMEHVVGRVLQRVHPDIGLLDGLDPLAHYSVTYLPLRGARGVAGVAMVGVRADRFDEEVLAGATTLAGSAGAALEMAHTSELEAEVSRALRSASTLEQLPQVDGYELAAFCLVEGKQATAGLGGDWYDVIALPSGSVAFVVGDVVGHGTPSVAAMAQFRGAVRAYLHAGHDPASTLTLLNGLAYHSHPGRLASVVVGTLDPPTGAVLIARAGHPPPVLAGGRLGLSPASEDPIIGVVSEHVYAQDERSIAPGQVLILYTDGLVERRDRPLDHGVTQLADRANAWAAEDAKALCRKLEDESRLDPDRTDDATVLAIGRTPSRPHRYVESLRPEVASVSGARRRSGAWLRRAGIEEDIVADAELAITELVANAIDASPVGAPIGLTIALDDYRVTIAVTNIGQPFTPPDVNVADPLRERGRGLKMIRALADRFDVDHEDGETTVSCAMVRTAG